MLRRRPAQEEALPELQRMVLSGRVDALRGSVDLLVVTATEVERDAVLRRLRPLRARKAILQGTIGPATYYLGALGEHGVVLTMCRMGTAGVGAGRSAVAVACAEWAPRAVVMVGIAFGKDPQKQRVGDVLVASQIIAYEEQRAGARTEYRGPVAEASATLIDRFRNVVGWKLPRKDGTACVMRVGPVLSGEKLVDDAAWKAALFEAFPQAIGGEMEGRGLHAAATEAGVAWLLVKGICDWGDGHKHDADHPLAAAAAVDLLVAALSPAASLDGLPSRPLGAPEEGSRARPQADPSSSTRAPASQADSRKGPIVVAGGRSVTARRDIRGSTVTTGDRAKTKR